MEKVLIHCTIIRGHHLEYLHHLYLGAVKNQDREYIFAVPENFNKTAKNYEWPTCNRVSFIFIAESMNYEGRLGLLRDSYSKCKSLKESLVKFDATRVVLIDFMSYLPFLPLFINSRIRVSGIVYRIYLFEWKEESLCAKFQDVIKYLLLSKCKVFESIYILNSRASAKCLNRIYKTSKFKYLPDPIASLKVSNADDIRKEYDIPQNTRVVLHPGGMLPYKGTLEILKAISLMDENTCSKFIFVFVGRITPSIRDEFFALEKNASTKARIIIEEGFLSFNRLGSWFVASDIILIPYQSKSQSSGIVGHSAFYNRPVVVAKEGLIGKVVKEYKMGCLLDKPDANSICAFFAKDTLCENFGSTDYVNDHTVDLFNYYIGI